MPALTRYDRWRTYAWNYEQAPREAGGAERAVAVPGTWSFCGLSAPSPLGIPAGPLLNGRWCLYYAERGFDVLTYKTVRSRPRSCYDLPNLQPVRCSSLVGGESRLPAVPEMDGSWAVSFGMPSMAPDVWRADVQWTRDQLAPEKLLSVSTVGTVGPGGTIEELAADYAQCVRWAVDSGADVVEVNFSCPNVDTCDGQLYQQPQAAAQVAEQAKSAAAKTPLVIKIGHLREEETAEALLRAVAPYATALSMTNSVAATVIGAEGEPMFEGKSRGICGTAIRNASLAQVRLMWKLIQRERLPLQIAGVGGVSTAGDVRQYLSAGAHHVQVATAAMLDPNLGLQIRRELAQLLGKVR